MTQVIAEIGAARSSSAPCRQQVSGRVGIFAAVRAWRRRRRLATDLLRLDDRLLADIGVDRGRLQSYLDGLS